MLRKSVRPNVPVECRANGARLFFHVPPGGEIVLAEGKREDFRQRAADQGARHPEPQWHRIPIDWCYLEVGGSGLWVAVMGWHAPCWDLAIDAPRAVAILDQADRAAEREQAGRRVLIGRARP